MPGQFRPLNYDNLLLAQCQKVVKPSISLHIVFIGYLFISVSGPIHVHANCYTLLFLFFDAYTKISKPNMSNLYDDHWRLTQRVLVNLASGISVDKFKENTDIFFKNDDATDSCERHAWWVSSKIDAGDTLNQWCVGGRSFYLSKSTFLLCLPVYKVVS